MDVNWLGVLISVILVFAIGALWYGPLFLKSWMLAQGLPADTRFKPHPARAFGGAGVAGIVAALAMNFLIGPNPDVSRGISVGLAAGIGIGATTIAINYGFANKSNALLIIDAGYTILLFTLIGVAFGLLG